MKKEIDNNKKKLLKVIIIATLLIGTLDILAAFINAFIRAETSPEIVLKFIASGLLGKEAFKMGDTSAVIGLLAHYLIACFWSSAFFIIYPKIEFASKYKIQVGLLYGVIIWLIMNLVILPLSNTPGVNFSFSRVLVGLLILMFNVGLPISLIYYHHKTK